MHTKDNCIFCDIAKNKNNARQKVENTVLFEDEHFYVMPSIGALVEGYVMIVPKRHINSISELSKKELSIFEHLFKTIKNMHKKIYGKIPIAYEHGTDAGGAGKFSNSINHAHFHIVPINFSSSNHKAVLAERQMFEIDFSKISQCAGKSYFLYCDENGKSHISFMPDMPRQYPRKKVAEQIGRQDEWDWRVFPCNENVKKTVSQWEQFAASAKLGGQAGKNRSV